ncbi:formyltransferase family protein [Candidatus Pseudothioglobus sp. Uisw_086]|uniref:formyltransferase family protein n=1 Tax=Candidatus Pseudothioglobus sp. Uisw_086 TaxID=3230998 RepID=UPI003A8BFBDA
MRVCFLVSGNGGNLKFFYLANKLGLIKNIELFVIADRECSALKFSHKRKIQSKVIHYTRKENSELLLGLKEISPDIIVTNWHKIIDKELVDKYSGRLINLHYSLLPSFPGMIGILPIEEAYKQGCKYIGATCHYVDNGVDTGKIISQTIVSTDIGIDSVIQNIYKNGCFILLNSLLTVTKDTSLISLDGDNDFRFSPPLKFNTEVFNDSFWGNLLEL